MFSINRPKSLKNRLVLYFTMVVLVVAIGINLFYFTVSENSLKQNMIDNAINTNLYITDNIEKQLSSIKQLSDWLFVNQSIDKLIYGSSDRSPSFLSLFDTFNFIQYQTMNSTIGKYISSLIYVRNTGIDIRTGLDAQQIDIEGIQRTDWFRSGLAGEGKLLWNSVIANPATVKTDQYIIPLVRPVLRWSTVQTDGWCMMGLQTTLVSDVFNQVSTNTGESLMVIDDKGICITDKSSKLVNADLSRYDYIKEILKTKDGNFVTDIGNQKSLVVFNRLPGVGWTMVHILTFQGFNRQNRFVINLTISIVAISALLSIVLIFFLSLNLTKPLKRLLTRMKEISGGDFKRDASLEGSDEMGLLGRGINEMAENIDKLLATVISEEAEKRRLEIKVLENQVNPHFVYNTLNLIKWMASVQKAEGVAEMVTALGRLLRSISRGTEEKITLREEISILNDYIYIQDARYNGKVEVRYNITDERLNDCRILKFTLQPIVENSIFHGIEPKKGKGLITLDVSANAGILKITISDNGVGMTEGQIDDILKDSPYSITSGFSGIGIKNVDSRIKLAYGEQYGLKIESLKGEYTVTHIYLPEEYQEVNANV